MRCLFRDDGPPYGHLTDRKFFRKCPRAKYRLNTPTRDEIAALTPGLFHSLASHSLVALRMARREGKRARIAVVGVTLRSVKEINAAPDTTLDEIFNAVIADGREIRLPDLPRVNRDVTIQ